MAHANPEFALARQFMRSSPGPLSAERRDIPTASDMARWMHRILATPPHRRSQLDAMAAQDFIAGAHRCAPSRQHHTSFEQLVVAGAPLRPKAGEKFVEPKRRWPTDVQRHGV